VPGGDIHFLFPAHLYLVYFDASAACAERTEIPPLAMGDAGQVIIIYVTKENPRIQIV
jgi:hypothetical protein